MKKRKITFTDEDRRKGAATLRALLDADPALQEKLSVNRARGIRERADKVRRALLFVHKVALLTPALPLTVDYTLEDIVSEARDVLSPHDY